MLTGSLTRDTSEDDRKELIISAEWARLGKKNRVIRRLQERRRETQAKMKMIKKNC